MHFKSRFTGQPHVSHAPPDRSSHNPPSPPIPGLCKGMPVDRSGARGTDLLTRVVLGLFLHDCRHTSLYEPLAGRPCLLIHHLADHLARKGISLKAPRLFNLCPLTKQSIAPSWERISSRTLAGIRSPTGICANSPVLSTSPQEPFP